MKISEKIPVLLEILFPQVLKLLVCRILTVKHLDWTVHMTMLTVANVQSTRCPSPALPRRGYDGDRAHTSISQAPNSCGVKTLISAY